MGVMKSSLQLNQSNVISPANMAALINSGIVCRHLPELYDFVF